MRTRLLALSLAALASACSSSNPTPQTPDPNNPTGGVAACPPGQFCPAANPTVTAPVTTATAPVPTATAPAGGGSSATPLPPLGAAAATALLQTMASSEAPGMKPDSGAFAGQFQEGQTLEQPFNIQIGKCYTVIGASSGIVELHVQIVAQQPPLPAVVLAQDNGTGPQPVLGGKGAGCWRNPLPIAGPGKIILKATKGSGMAAAQVFVK
jgi:hypothetical protein